MSGLEAILAIAGLAIAVPGVVQTVIHTSRYLSRQLQSAPPTPEVRKLRGFVTSLNRGTIRATLEAIEDLYCETTDADLKRHIDDLVKQLWHQILKIGEDVNNTTRGNQVMTSKKSARDVAQRMKEVERLEESLRKYVQVQAAGKAIRSRLELRSNQCSVIGLPERLSHSSVCLAKADLRTKDLQSIVSCIIEEKTLAGLGSPAAYEATKDFARILQFTKDSEGLLRLAGFQLLQKSMVSDTFRLIFPFPFNGQNPRSLRDILLDPVNQPVPPIPRNYRFILPRKLAESVFHVHRHNLVHKAIRPESIILFEPQGGVDPQQTRYPNVIGTPYLTDWRYTRKTIDSSNLSTETDWTMAIYQHPQRQAGLGTVAESKYNIGHDIYSLGVCLLEIGLWESLIQYNGETPILSVTVTEATAKWKSENPIRACGMSESQIEQQAFLLLAGQRLAYEMGDAYSRMVIKCLSCLENGFGNVLMFVDSTSRDWDEQGVLFIQEIRRELAGACTMGVGPYNLN